jgi:hypothetical protein
VVLGASVASLENLDVPLQRDPAKPDHQVAKLGPLRVSLCGDIVDEVWIEDLRQTKPCAEAKGKPVSPTIAHDVLAGRFTGCKDNRRLGGSYDDCEEGGIRIGRGLGTYLQIRIKRRGSTLDEICSKSIFK